MKRDDDNWILNSLPYGYMVGFLYSVVQVSIDKYLFIIYLALCVGQGNLMFRLRNIIQVNESSLISRSCARFIK